MKQTLPVVNKVMCCIMYQHDESEIHSEYARQSGAEMGNNERTRHNT